MGRIDALLKHNCDDVHQSGSRTDGVYEINTGNKLTPVYCEFNQGGHNWLVCKVKIRLVSSGTR